MKFDTANLDWRLATSEADLRGAERLRYQVFVEELGGDGALVDHDQRFEKDRFDSYFEHLIVIDKSVSPATLEHVVGVYRVMTGAAAQDAGQFYSEDEYDLSRLKGSGRRLLELGRSCVRKDFRSGLVLHMLWQGLAEYALKREIEVLFGVASFQGTDMPKLSEPLSHLYHSHLAPPELRVRALESVYQPMDLIAPEKIDRVAAMRQVPQLIKSYLRLGGFVGDGAFIDHDFNTTDVCLVIDTMRMKADSRQRYSIGLVS